MRIEVEGLSFGYAAGRPVLDGVSFTYESPEVLCLLGSNGVGKSTLLKCIMGELTPTGGRILVDGRPVRSYAPRELARKVAYIAQSHTPTFSYSVLDVVTMGRTAHIGYLASPGADDVAFAYEQLAYLGIERLADRPYTDVSGGERQLVMIASALAQEPEAMLLDEPTAHLDFGNQFKFIELVERLRDRGIGVLMTTHFPDHALLLGYQTVVLRSGSVGECGPARDVVVPQTLRKIYGIEVHVAEVGRRAVCVPGSLDDPLGRGAGAADGALVDGGAPADDGTPVGAGAPADDGAPAGEKTAGEPLPEEYRVDPERIHEMSLGYWSGRAPEYSQLHEREADTLRGAAFARWVAGLVGDLADGRADGLEADLPGAVPGLRVLDLGCGSGFVSIALAAAGCTVTSVDFSDHMLDQARANLERRGLLGRVTLRRMDAHELDFADGTFDLVMSRNVTWVLEDVGRVYAEALRVLRPGGRLVNIDGDYGRGMLARVRSGVAPSHPTQTPEQLKVRDTVAANLAISQVERPAWDMAELWRRGASDVRCQRSLNRLLLEQMPAGTDPAAVQAEPGTQGDLFVLTAVR